MFGKLLILFITVPLVELFLLGFISSRVGLIPTLLLVVVTGFWGAWLARSQGASILSRIQSEVKAGRTPAAELVDGLLVLVGGIVLLTPGLLTDILGFSLMIPAFRAILRKALRSRLEAHAARFKMKGSPSADGDKGVAHQDEDFIDI